MIKEGKFDLRSEGCICESGSDIMTKWRDMRSKFGYTTLGDISLGGVGYE